MTTRHGLDRLRLSGGLSLPELLVATTVFLLLNGAVLALMSYNQRSSEKAVSNTDASSQVLLLFEKLRSELRRGRVVDCSEFVLSYWIYDQENGLPLPGQPHRLSFLPRGSEEPALAEITAHETQGRLVRKFEGREDTLLKLGRDSEVKFVWTQSLHMLRVEGAVREEDEARPLLSSEKKFLFTVPLNNVE